MIRHLLAFARRNYWFALHWFIRMVGFSPPILRSWSGAWPTPTLLATGRPFIPPPRGHVYGTCTARRDDFRATP